MPKPFIPFSAKITRDIFDIRKKSKLKLVKKKTPSIIKLPAQKSPKSFLSEEAKSIETADKAARKKFGEGISYLPGMNVKSTQRLAAESYASQVEERMFSKTLFRERKASRLRTASGIKGKKFKIKTPTAPSKLQQKFGIFKSSSLPKSKASLRLAKSKGALGAYKTADIKGQQAFSKIVEKYTSQAKRSSFKMKSIKAKKSTFSNERLKQMGLDEREVSAMVGRTYKTYRENPKYNIFKKRK